MNTFTVTMTDIKTNPSDIFNRVFYEKKTALVTRHDKIIARVSPEDKSTASQKSPTEAWSHSGGIMLNFPDVTKFRRNKRQWLKI